MDKLFFLKLAEKLCDEGSARLADAGKFKETDPYGSRIEVGVASLLISLGKVAREMAQ